MMKRLSSTLLIVLGLSGYGYGLYSRGEIQGLNNQVYLIKMGGVDRASRKQVLGLRGIKEKEARLSNIKTKPLASMKQAIENLSMDVREILDAYNVSGNVSMDGQVQKGGELPIIPDSPDIGASSLRVKVHVSSNSQVDTLDAFRQMMEKMPYYSPEMVKWEKTKIYSKGSVIGFTRSKL